MSSSDYGQVIYFSQDYLNKISDSDLKNRLTSEIDALITQAKGKQQLIDDGTYLKAYKNSNTGAYYTGT